MLVRNGNDHLEVTVAERSTGAYDAGDTRFAVRLRVSGMETVFSAESLCWVELRALAAFAEQLQTLDERRQGCAVLESMSPDELRLEVRVTDPAGHVAAVGQVGRLLGVGAGEPYWSAVAFRVPFCPTELPALVREFSELAIAPVATPDAARM